MDKKKLRRRYFIDGNVQTGIVKRLAFYWVASILFLTLPIAFYKTLFDPSVFFFSHVANVFIEHWSVFLMMMVFLPFAMRDAVRFSNRFTGPIYRLRSELKKFSDGEKMNPIKFRNADFWHDLADGVNQVSARLNELESELHEKSESPGETKSDDTELDYTEHTATV